GAGDGLTYQWSITSSGIAPSLINGLSQPTLSFNRNHDLDASYVISLTVADDDGAAASYVFGLRLGTDDLANPDQLVITNADFAGAGVRNLLVLGLKGNDTIDATAVSA